MSQTGSHQGRVEPREFQKRFFFHAKRKKHVVEQNVDDTVQRLRADECGFVRQGGDRLQIISVATKFGENETSRWPLLCVLHLEIT